MDNVIGGLLTAELHAPGEAPLHGASGGTAVSPMPKRRSSLASSLRKDGKDGGEGADAAGGEGKGGDEGGEGGRAESAGGSSEQGGEKKLTILSGTLKKKKKNLAGAMPSASAEIFYLAKAAKQAKEAEDALALSAKLEADKEKAEMSNRNSALLTAKANREASALQEKLEGAAAEKQSLMRQIRNLKVRRGAMACHRSATSARRAALGCAPSVQVELLQSKETEDKMSKVALDEKRKAERAVNELVAAQLEMGKRPTRASNRPLKHTAHAPPRSPIAYRSRTHALAPARAPEPSSAPSPRPSTLASPTLAPPSTAFHLLPPPSTLASPTLAPPSTAFHLLPPPSTAFHRLPPWPRPRWPRLAGKLRVEIEAYQKGDPSAARAEQAEKELTLVRAEAEAAVASAAEHQEAREKLGEEVSALAHRRDRRAALRVALLTAHFEGCPPHCPG